MKKIKVIIASDNCIYIYADAFEKTDDSFIFYKKVGEKLDIVAVFPNSVIVINTDVIVDY